MTDPIIAPKKSAQGISAKATALAALIATGMPATPAEPTTSGAGAKAPPGRIDAIRPALATEPFVVTSKDGKGAPISLPPTPNSAAIFKAAKEQGFTLKYEGDEYFLYDRSGKELAKINVAGNLAGNAITFGLGIREAKIGDHVAAYMKSNLTKQGIPIVSDKLDYAKQNLPKNIVKEAEAHNIVIRPSMRFADQYEIFVPDKTGREKKVSDFTFGAANPNSVRGRNELTLALCNTLEKIGDKGPANPETLELKFPGGPTTLKSSSPYFSEFKQLFGKGYQVGFTVSGGVLSKDGKETRIGITSDNGTPLEALSQKILLHEVGLELRRALAENKF